MVIATGNLNVTITAQPSDESPQGAPVSRSLIEKTFEGGLDAVSRGLMLATGGTVKGSAGYVAMEFVSGVLDGHTGNFALQHFGLMHRGTPELRVVVVPDSGTGELEGLSGTLVIDIVAGQHRYSLDYTLP